MKPLSLLIGSSGKTGSRITAALQKLGYLVRLGSRVASPAFERTR